MRLPHEILVKPTTTKPVYMAATEDESVCLNSSNIPYIRLATMEDVMDYVSKVNTLRENTELAMQKVRDLLSDMRAIFAQIISEVDRRDALLWRIKEMAENGIGKAHAAVCEAWREGGAE